MHYVVHPFLRPLCAASLDVDVIAYQQLHGKEVLDISLTARNLNDLHVSSRFVLLQAKVSLQLTLRNVLKSQNSLSLSVPGHTLLASFDLALIFASSDGSMFRSWSCGCLLTQSLPNGLW